MSTGKEYSELLYHTSTGNYKKKTTKIVSNELGKALFHLRTVNVCVVDYAAL